MKRYLCCYFTCLFTLLTACTPSNPASEPVTPLKTVTLDNTVRVIAGQTVYVPIYSSIFMWDQKRTIDLTATLSVRNTDLINPMIISSVNYFDSRGKLIRKYLQQPVELGALSSTDFVVNQQDTLGGSGAAFVVEWVAQKEVSQPVIESIMINTSGNQGISFVSAGRVIKNRAGGK